MTTNFDTAYYIGLIIALDELFKKLGLNAKILPLINIAIGILISFTFGENWQISVIKGLEMGLVASGLYSSSKNTIQILNKKENVKKDISH